MRDRRRTELLIIYTTAALLMVSLVNLGIKAISVNNAAKYENLFPSLVVEKTPDIVAPQQKTVYFTFDDGPSHNTERILDILASENVKATFFVCAQKCDDVDAPAVLRRILEEGHEIGLHSYTHDYNKIYRSLEGYLEDLNKINDYVVEATGYHSNIIRFPGGSGTINMTKGLKKRIIEEITSRGYRYYDWDVESGDQTSKVNSAEYLSDKILRGTKKKKNGEDKQRVIVLLHDSPKPKTSADAVKQVIPVLRERGYAFDKLTASVDSKKDFS